ASPDGPASSTASAVSTPPAWIPAYTPQQLALLTPVEHAIRVAAERVLPDLERFGYADNQPLESPVAFVGFARMVAKVLNDSPRFYTLEEAPAGTANPIVQYG